MKTPKNITLRGVLATGALVATLVTLGPVTGAAAETDGEATTESSVSREDRSAARTARAEARVELRAWLSARKEIHQVRVAATRAARESLRAALDSAASPEDRKAARSAFKDAMRAAKSAHDAAIADLGPRPVVSRG